MSRRHKQQETDITSSQTSSTKVVSESTAQKESHTGSGIKAIEDHKDVHKRPGILLGSMSSDYLEHIVRVVINGTINHKMSEEELIHMVSSIAPTEVVDNSSTNAELTDIELTDTISHSMTAPRGRGRPVIERLCSKFSDNSIWEMAKSIYRKIYHTSIKMAKNIVQYLVCFLCSIFKINDTETEYGRVEHFHRIMSGHLSKSIMPTVRSLQLKLKWFKEWKRSKIITAKETADEVKHVVWEKLVNTIYGHMVELSPAYAI